MQQARRAFGNPHLSALVNWPEEPYFKNADFEIIPSPWQLVGAARGSPVPLQLARTLGGLLRAKFAAGSGGWERMFGAFQRADMVIAVSGNQFYSTGRYGWPFPVQALPVQLAHIFRKPFYVLPQTIGPLKRGWERTLMRFIYGRARMVFLREHISVRLAREIGIPEEKLRYSPDPAFAYPAASRDEAQQIMGRWGWTPGTPTVGATVIARMGRSLNPGAVDRYYVAVARALARLSDEHGAFVYLFCQVTGPTTYDDDRTAAQTVMNMMGGQAREVRLVDETLSPGQLKACYGLMNLFLGSRLHSGIFALGMGVPSVLINYLSKTRGVLEALGLGDWSVDLSDTSDAAFEELICRVWLERSERASRLAALLPEVIAQAAKPMEWIAQDYYAIEAR